jgi:uncharacterized protein YqeY
MTSLKEQITNDMKNYMRAQEKEKLGVIRLVQAAIKQREVDERITLDDTQILAVLEKMSKQRRESIEQFQKANRDDLVNQERFELEIIQAYLPEQLSDEEIAAIVTAEVKAIGATTIKDMGKVMAAVKPKLQGRADMTKVSELIKSHLS